MRGGEGRAIRVQVKISLSYNRSLISNLMLNITNPFNVVCDKPQLALEALSFAGGTPYSEVIEFYVQQNLIPSSSQVTVSGTYCAGEGGDDMRSIEDSFNLPLTFFAQILPPENVKEAHKLTISTNQTSSKISDFF